MSSIYNKLNNTEDYNGKVGMEEVNCLYFYTGIPKRIKVLLADDIIESIMKIQKSKEEKVVLTIPDFPLISYVDILIKKINVLVKEKIIGQKWIKEFTLNLIFESEDKKAVQLGLALGGKYLPKKYLEDVIFTFSKSGNYIFYLKESIENLKGYNSFLLDLARKTNGTIRLFAVTNLEPINSDIRKFIIEESYKDEIEENLIIEYILGNIDISKYIGETKLTSKEISNLGYLISEHIINKGLRSLDNKEEIVNNFVPFAISGGNDIYCLYSLYLIGNELKDDKEFKLNKEKIINNIEEELLNPKWKNVFENAIKGCKVEANILLDLSFYYGYKISFNELKPYLEREIKNVDIYEYISVNGSLEEQKQLFNFFEENFNIDSLMQKPEDISNEDIDDRYIDDILFFFVLRGLKLNKDLAIRALSARITNTRWQAVNMLERYNTFSDDEREQIRLALENEPNEDIKFRLDSLLYDSRNFKKKFINVRDIIVHPFINDIYIQTICIEDVKKRNQYYLQTEIEENSIYYIKIYKEENEEEERVKVIGPSGYIIGNLPKKESEILSNLLEGSKYLYCKIDKYDLTKNYISLDVYLSARDIIDFCQETIKLMSYPSDFNNS